MLPSVGEDLYCFQNHWFPYFWICSSYLLNAAKGHRSLLGGEDSEANKAAWQKFGSATVAVTKDKGFDEEAEEAKA
jgi:hypothetical protein